MMKRILIVVLTGVSCLTVGAGTYYVDAKNGNDEWDGEAEVHVADTLRGPRQSLAKIVEVANQASDVIIALPGYYTNGVCDTASPTRSRVSVPAGVTLKSKSGASRTFIVGARGRKDNDVRGNGTNAVRCVRFAGYSASVVGFTLCNGHTCGKSCGGDDEQYGGAVGGSTCSIVDCIISNNAAVRGGAVYSMNCYRCRFYDNKDTDKAAAVGMGRVCFYNCYVENTYSSPVCYLNQSVSSSNKSYAYNSFFYCHDNGTGPRDITAAYNCVFVGNLDGGRSATAYTTFNHCWFTAKPKSEYAVLNDCRTDFTSFGQFGMNTEGKIFADSIMIDAGSNSYLQSGAAGTALNGVQRISNATIDMGCSEYNWTVKYGGVLAEERLVVTNASAYVVKKDEKTLTIPKDGSLSLVWDCRPGDRSFVATVQGEGSLTWTLDGVEQAPVTAATSGTVNLTVTRGAHDLSFAFLGQGSADLGEFQNKNGLILFVR